MVDNPKSLTNGENFSADSLEETLRHIKSLFLSGALSDARSASIALEGRLLNEDEWWQAYKCLRSVRDNTRAELITAQFIRRNPGHERATGELLAQLAEVGRIDDATRLVEQYAANFGMSTALSLQLARRQIGSKRFNEAKVAASQVLIVEPNSIDARIILIQALKGLSSKFELRRQVKIFSRVIRETPRDLIRLAEVSLWAGRRRQARLALERALRLEQISDYHRGEIVGLLIEIGKYECSFENLQEINIERSSDVEFLRKLEKSANRLSERLVPKYALADIVVRIEIRLIELSSSTIQNQARLDSLRAELLLQSPTLHQRSTFAGYARKCIRTILRRG